MSAVQTPASHQGTAPAARAMRFGPGADCSLELTGVLLHAEVAMKPLGDGTFAPAIQMEIDDVGAGHHRVVAHVIFNAREQAEARVKTLKRGEQVTVGTQLTDLRLLLPAAFFPNDKP